MLENKDIINEPIKEYLPQEELNKLMYEVIEKENLDYFHIFDKAYNSTSVSDSNIFNYLSQAEQIRFLNETPYIYEDGICKRDEDGSILMTMIKKLIYPRFQRIGTIKRVYGLFVNDRWLKVNMSWFNRHPPEYVIFENAAYKEDRLFSFGFAFNNVAPC